MGENDTLRCKKMKTESKIKLYHYFLKIIQRAVVRFQNTVGNSLLGDELGLEL